MKGLTFVSWPILLLLPLALIFDLSGVSRYWRDKTLFIVSPGLKLATDVRYAGSQSMAQISLLPQAARQVVVLQNELIQTQTLQAQLKSTQDENQTLRQQLNMPALSQPKLLVTTIISYPDPLVQLPVQNSDLEGGLVLGQGVLLGFIKNVATGYGTIEVLASQNSRRVLAKTTGNVQGIISFDGKNLTMSAVDRQAKVTPNELIVTMGQPGIPPNLVIGNVGQEISQLTAPTQTLMVNQPTSLYQERIVEVLKP